MNTKRIKQGLLATTAAALFSVNAIAQHSSDGNVELVGDIKGTQITGVTVSNDGRVFVNAPNWRDENQVVKLALPLMRSKTRYALV